MGRGGGDGLGGRGHRLGVLGWPVAHSLSPAIHNAALRAAGLGGWRYQLLPAPPELFDEIVRGLPAAGFVGANVTIPHKEAALRLADSATDRAQAIGAANTLMFSAGAVTADNTDAPALAQALPGPVAGRRAVVVGAGGSARSTVWALRDAGAEVMVYNRSAARAEALCADLGAILVTEIPSGDVLVNCTSVGLHGESFFDALPLRREALTSYGCVVDFVYGPGGTALIAAARELGVATVTGLELLIGQGALAFELFTGQPASLAAMREAVSRP